MQRLRRGLQLLLNSPGYLVRRVGREALMEVDRWRLPLLERRLDAAQLPLVLGFYGIDEAWNTLACREFPFVTDAQSAGKFMSQTARNAIIDRARLAMQRKVNLLGSGEISLGSPIDWRTDLKVGHTWPNGFCRSIVYSNPADRSDVKIPWEVSRLHWLIPVGQAYVLTGNEDYANFAMQVFNEWIDANPTGFSVSWACTMEPALRIITWIWFFHVCARSDAWRNPSFQLKFLKALYLHGVFVERHIERAQINGNHYTADAAGMVWAGLFFAGAQCASRWSETGWKILANEIEVQVHPDGVDFEASSAYHRLVAELFWIAAHYRKAVCEAPREDYWARLSAMAEVTRHLCRPDGSVPCWGDADDARALPLGLQDINDHRYLVDLIGLSAGTTAGVSARDGGELEVQWVFGHLQEIERQPVTSKAFHDGGVFILCDRRTHIMIDCGPIGLAGLGGHGHNDALSFELWCDGSALIVDPGSYVYTADYEARNRFRSTASHNTPQIDDIEINRFYSRDNLWNLHDDARPELVAFSAQEGVSSFAGRHYGYARLPSPVIVERRMVLDSAAYILTIEDSFAVEGEAHSHLVRLPFHFAPHVEAAIDPQSDVVSVRSGDRRYRIRIEGGTAGRSVIEPTEISRSYGVQVPSTKLVHSTCLADGLVLKTIIDLAP